jgi:hypothetical protein
MPLTSTPERPCKVRRDRSVRRLRCADVVVDGRGLIMERGRRRLGGFNRNTATNVIFVEVFAFPILNITPMSAGSLFFPTRPPPMESPS